MRSRTTPRPPRRGSDPKKEEERSCASRHPPGFVTWSETSFERLIGGAPEPLESRIAGVGGDAHQPHRAAGETCSATLGRSSRRTMSRPTGSASSCAAPSASPRPSCAPVSSSSSRADGSRSPSICSRQLLHSMRALSPFALASHRVARPGGTTPHGARAAYREARRRATIWPACRALGCRCLRADVR